MPISLGPGADAGKRARMRVRALALLALVPFAVPTQAADPVQALGIVPVKILVDDDEPAARQRWETVLRERVARASKIFAQNFGIRFEVAAVDTWETDVKLRSFDQLFIEFAREVKPEPARLALGFCRQRLDPTRARRNLGGIPGPFGAHVLLSENAHISETERVEVLVHELGHFLGAPHSPDPNSVMRPELGDGKARSRRFTVGFDPTSNLILKAVAKEFRERDIAALADLTERNKALLRELYAGIDRQLPGDPVAGRYLALLDEEPSEADPRRTAGNLLVEQVRGIVAAVVQAAEDNRRLPLSDEAGSGKPRRRSGDELTEFYFRAAASAARTLPTEQAPRALLVGLAVALDTSQVMRSNILTKPLWNAVESPREYQSRVQAVGLPTMHRRHDLLQHFVVSAALTVLYSSNMAETVGMQKEILDSKGGSGFSFVDLAADLAGIALASELVRQPELPREFVTQFQVADYLPAPSDLTEGYQWAKLIERYGGPSDPRFLVQVEEIRRRVREMPGLVRLARGEQPAPAPPLPAPPGDSKP